MTFNILNASFDKKHPYSLKLTVACCPGNNFSKYDLMFPSMEGNLPIETEQEKLFQEKLFRRISAIYRVGEKTSSKIAKKVDEANIQIEI